MVAIADKLLGRGIYSVDEAAFYLRVPKKTISRWVFGDVQGQAVVERELPDEDDKIVTFLDFIQALHIRQIRTDTDCKIALPKIRDAIKTAREKYSSPYPLATKHTTYLYGNELTIAVGNDKDVPREFVEITGKNKHHGMIGKVVELYGKDLTFDPATGFANGYRAGVYSGTEIWMKPAIRFGEPIVSECGYTARTLYEATVTEGDFEKVAQAYGVLVSQVEAGYRYIQSLSTAA
jgi:uncharacterized protein (DUF433 family)